MGADNSLLSWAILEIVDAGIPKELAIAAGSKPCGVPKTVSNPSAPRCGRVENIPPPSLLITINLQLMFSCVIKPVMSWRKAKSPRTANV